MSKDPQIAEAEGKLFRLMRAFTIQANKIDSWSRRMIGLKEKGTSPSLIKKLLKLSDQVFFFKKRELQIIREIEDVEKRHFYLRQQKLLRKAPLKVNEAAFNPMQDDEERPKSNNLIMLLWLWILMRKSNSSKATNSLKLN